MQRGYKTNRICYVSEHYKRDINFFNMKSIVAIILAFFSSDITNEKLQKTCTIDDIDFDCNNGQIHFRVKNCQVDDFFKVVGTRESKCSIKSNRMELEYKSCGTKKILNDNEMIYTITLGQFLTEKGIIYNNKRSFSCKVDRKHTVAAKYSTVSTKFPVLNQ